jgi:DDE_Tnp_1-associated
MIFQPKNKRMSLLDYLARVPDFRRKQGLRYHLDTVLTIQVLAMMSGCIHTRAIARFAKNHQKELATFLPLKHGVPSHVTFQEILSHLDVGALQEQFNAWAATLFTPQEYDEILKRVAATDGKALRATMSDYATPYQDFVCFVHVFAVQSGIILHAEQYQNGHTSEITALQEVLKKLSLRGAIFTMDALHTQKKR